MGLFDFLRPKESIIDTGVLRGSCDSHSHVLFGLDDGAETLQDSLDILSFYEKVGIAELWCTPHVMEDVPNTTETLKQRFAELCDAYDGPISLNLAAEYMLDSVFEERLETEDLLTYPGDVLLVETSTSIPPYNLWDILDKILCKGYRPILAHPERSRYLQMIDYENLKDYGVYFQLNIGSLVGYYGETAQKKAWLILEEGWYQAAGSDCHRLSSVQSQFYRQALPPKVCSDLKKLYRTIPTHGNL